MSVPSDALSALAIFALDHGVASIERGGPLIPMLIAETGGTRTLDRFVAERLDEALALARDAARSTSADRFVVVYDGYLTVDGRRSDAVYAEVAERDEPVTHLFVHRYAPAGLRRRNRSVGSAAYLGSTPAP